jgi:hypothetical protein
VALHVDQIAAVLLCGRMPEVAPADVVEQGGRLKAGDVTAQFGRLLVRAQDDRDGIPADGRADPVFDGAVPGRLCFAIAGIVLQ